MSAPDGYVKPKLPCVCTSVPVVDQSVVVVVLPVPKVELVRILPVVVPAEVVVQVLSPRALVVQVSFA